MTYKELLYLSVQIVCILIFMVWMCFLIVNIKKQRYGYWYIAVRYMFYRDSKPYKWLMANKVYIGYLVQLLSLVFLNIGLIQEIAEDTVFTKSWPFFVGNILLGTSACFTLRMKLTKRQN